MKANDMQVGGTHYQSLSQHWDFVLVVLNNRYLEGQVTKYLTRHDKPGGRGVQDLHKSQHYLAKLIETVGLNAYPNMPGTRFMNGYHTQLFIDENKLGEIESSVVWALAHWVHDGEKYHLTNATTALDALVSWVTDPAEPSGRGYVAQ